MEDRDAIVMADYRISNLTVRVEEQALPQGVVRSQGKYLGDARAAADNRVVAEAAAGCGCTCSCTCSCTCTSTSGGSLTDGEELQRQDIPDVELTVLRESLRAALEDLEQIAQQKRAR
ncbi:hypothetical protein GCM10010259_25090 [Streptomyces daghestanicus]|nr:hypothetical protein GCM10010240_01060 [Streptomyces griseoviridis]GGU33619.1 hypothetical protein GCM10010259_25090 [Streptomyces daghestanicus]GHI34217.1 hypothetical protein Sdagh_59470 [Streptomyces daghestanicus]